MKNLLISLIVSAGLMSVAHAGDAEAGKAKSATCAACHGADGNSLAPTFPKIAGQGERYLIKQIKDIRDGNRQVPSMAPFVAGLSDADIADLAAYFSAQVPTTGGAKAELVELGQRIYARVLKAKVFRPVWHATVRMAKALTPLASHALLVSTMPTLRLS